jgi:hypothetical protein
MKRFLSLITLGTDQIRERNVFPAGFMRLPHVKQSAAVMEHLEMAKAIHAELTGAAPPPTLPRRDGAARNSDARLPPASSVAH